VGWVIWVNGMATGEEADGQEKEDRPPYSTQSQAAAVEGIALGGSQLRRRPRVEHVMPPRRRNEQGERRLKHKQTIEPKCESANGKCDGDQE
jgi:hypothetical protein